MRFIPPLAILLIGYATPPLAQQPMSIVRVHVVDTTGAPIGSADVAVVRGLNASVASGTTDARGMRTLLIPRSNDEFQLVVRRIGFQRGDRFFRPSQDSMSLIVKLRTTPRELPAMEVMAQQDIKRKRYHIGADDIEASKRPIVDGLDVVTKLRPDMMFPPGQGIFVKCYTFFVWINGKRMVLQPIDPGLAKRTEYGRRAARVTPHMGITGQAAMSVTVQSVLAKIHPEHIEEMNYIDCRDNTLKLASAQGAIFVVLKPGVAYDEVRGTYVIEGPAVASVDDDVQALQPDSTMSVVSAAYRSRLLGLFDESTGEPIVGAEVIDSGTGTFALTSVTGTVTLAFLPDGASTLRIRKAGYAETKLEVSISPRDTIPLTLTLAKPPR